MYVRTLWGFANATVGSMSCSLLPSHVWVLGPGGWKAVSLWLSRGRACVLCWPWPGWPYSLPAREWVCPVQAGGGRMPSCSPGPVAARPQWTLADPPHSPSCFPREGPRHQTLHLHREHVPSATTCRAPAVSQQALVDLTLPSEADPVPLPPYTHSPLSISHPLHALPTSDTFPSICSKPTPPLSLQIVTHSQGQPQSHLPWKPSWIAPAQSCRFLPVLNSLALDYTGCLGSSPNCLMEDNNNSFC